MGDDCLTPGLTERQRRFVVEYVEDQNAAAAAIRAGYSPKKAATMLLVYDVCEQFIRTIPLLVADRHNVEDIDTSGEDHIYDEACHACMARPLAWRDPARRPGPAAGIIDAVLAGSRNDEEAPWGTGIKAGCGPRRRWRP